eukprot:1444212-Amphidinium_carterae.2
MPGSAVWVDSPDSRRACINGHEWYHCWFCCEEGRWHCQGKVGFYDLVKFGWQRGWWQDRGFGIGWGNNLGSAGEGRPHSKRLLQDRSLKWIM